MSASATPIDPDQAILSSVSLSLYYALQNLLSRVRPDYIPYYIDLIPETPLRNIDIPEGFTDSYTDILNYLPKILQNDNISIELRSLNATLYSVIWPLVDHQLGRVELFISNGTLTSLVELFLSPATSADSSLERFQDYFAEHVGYMTARLEAFSRTLGERMAERALDDGLLDGLIRWTYVRDTDTASRTYSFPFPLPSAYQSDKVLMYGAL